MARTKRSISSPGNLGLPLGRKVKTGRTLSESEEVRVEGPAPSRLQPATTKEKGPRNGSEESETSSNPERSSSVSGKHVKPPMSFSALIKEAIMKSPQKRLLLHEIYENISAAHPYFKTAGDGWKNSVRHNLSINTMFCKIPRNVIDDPNAAAAGDSKLSSAASKQKKGCYWILRDLSTLAEDRYRVYDERRRRSLAHLFARSQEEFPYGGSDVIRIMPFTPAPSLLNVGRRFSEPNMATQNFHRPSVSVEELRRQTDFNTQLNQFYMQQQNIPMFSQINQPPYESMMPLDAQMSGPPPSFEYELFNPNDMPWLATEAQLPGISSYAQNYPDPQVSTNLPASLHSQTESVENRQVLPKVARASTVGPGTLPRRNLMDIWLSGTPPMDYIAPKESKFDL